ncbi:MAG: flagellar basal body-associated FliL family protein [Planctomycetes bacterium]|nr:flagellar basal body-associated FliL family protein [Planctomycetota bacterium]
MAEEKKKEGDGKADQARKKGLPAIVMIAVGAIAGGAGVVFAVPPKEKVVIVAEKPPELIDVRHPDEIQHEFNPKSDAGRRIARVNFKFVYTVLETREKEAFELLQRHWEEAKAATLEVLANRAIDELSSETGRRLLEKDLVDELDRTLFPGRKEAKVARVTRVYFLNRLFQ